MSITRSSIRFQVTKPNKNVKKVNLNSLKKKKQLKIGIGGSIKTNKRGRP
tara:strand:+ start:340 stop:489 length:150 start_codon:yes stop_codon:yes gene_type:complete